VWLLMALTVPCAAVLFRYIIDPGHASPWLAAGAAVTLLPLAAVAVRVHWHAHRVARRRAAGECLRCGYDLTGNVSGTCPECGTPAQVK
jgi:hypothetical protein